MVGKQTIGSKIARDYTFREMSKGTVAGLARRINKAISKAIDNAWDAWEASGKRR